MNRRTFLKGGAALMALTGCAGGMPGTRRLDPTPPAAPPVPLPPAKPAVRPRVLPPLRGRFTGLLTQNPKRLGARSLSKEAYAAAIEGDSEHRVMRPGAAEAVLRFARGLGMPATTLAELATFIRSDQVWVDDGVNHIPHIASMGRYHLRSGEVTIDFGRKVPYPNELVLVWHNPATGRDEAFVSLICGNPLLFDTPDPVVPCTTRWWVPQGWVGDGYATLAFREEDVELALQCLPESARCDWECTQYFNRTPHENADVRAMQSALGGRIKAINVDRPGDRWDSEGFWIPMHPSIEMIWNCEQDEAAAMMQG